MLHSDLRITEQVTLVRFYYYDDINMGWGDAGTAGYFSIPLSELIEEENTRFDGSNYFTYKIKREYINELFNGGGYDMGYELASETQRENEINKAKRILEMLEK